LKKTAAKESVAKKKIVHGDGIKKNLAHNDPRKKFPASSKSPPPLKS
jgi:hypothetical protein